MHRFTQPLKPGQSRSNQFDPSSGPVKAGKTKIPLWAAFFSSADWSIRPGPELNHLSGWG
jgi:hypothetical protein